MREFLDKKNQILWRMTDYKKSGTSQEDYRQIKKYNDELNTWKSDNITQFITYTDLPLGDYLSGLVVRNNKRSDLGEYHQIYAFDMQDHLIGSCIVSAKSPFTRMVTQDPVLKQSLLLNMIITNPNLARQGIGSRMVNSITKNQHHFVAAKTYGVMAAVNKKNEASKRAFLKNKFKIMHDGREKLIPDQHDIVFRQYPPYVQKKPQQNKASGSENKKQTTSQSTQSTNTTSQTPIPNKKEQMGE